MDIGKIMKMAQQMQTKLNDAQSEAQHVRHEGEAGAGLVRVVLNGKHEMVDIHIDPKAVEDIDLLEDLVRAAVNQAAGKVSDGLQHSLGSMAQGMGLDLSALVPGGKSGDEG